MTFEELYTECQELTGDSSAGSLILFKRWINKARGNFNSALGRYVTRKEKTTDTVASQQYYQLPKDCIRVTGVVYDDGTTETPLTQIVSEDKWRELNMYASTGTPEGFFIRGIDEFGLYPKPASAVVNGIIVYYESSERDMTQEDYVTGTVTVTNGSATVTGSGTTFTANMVGRSFEVTDDSGGQYYKIAAYVGATEITLDNYYEEATGAGKTYAIGETSQIPEEFHTSFVDYAMMRYAMKQKDRAGKSDYKDLYEAAIEEAKNRYGSKTTKQVFNNKRKLTDVFRQTGTLS